ncbi:hypothetical protein OHR68_37635 [Spirillospora sp. NBC_00431]
MIDAPNSSSFEKFVTRGINPVGFTFVLLAFLFLPCAALSPGDLFSDIEGTTSVESALDISSTGANMAVHQSDYDWPVFIRLLAIVTLLVIVAGALTALARPAQRRPLYGAIVAVVSFVLLVVTGLAATARMESAFKEFLDVLFATVPKSESEPLIDQAGDAVGLGVGFWVALVVVALVAAMNLVVLFRVRTTTRFSPAEI